MRRWLHDAPTTTDGAAGAPTPSPRLGPHLALFEAIGHISEEVARPVANDIYLSVDRNATYVPLD